jgi:hypothetical protein
MGWRDWASQLVRPPAAALTPARIRGAYAVAIAADVLQLAVGPLGWAFADEIIDILAMLAVAKLIGFHPLLLPTFVIEFVPIADMLPTWTGCVALVVTLRRRQAPPPTDGDEAVTIDVKPTSVS